MGRVVTLVSYLPFTEFAVNAEFESRPVSTCRARTPPMSSAPTPMTPAMDTPDNLPEVVRLIKASGAKCGSAEAAESLAWALVKAYSCPDLETFAEVVTMNRFETMREAKFKDQLGEGFILTFQRNHQIQLKKMELPEFDGGAAKSKGKDGPGGHSNIRKYCKDMQSLSQQLGEEELASLTASFAHFKDLFSDSFDPKKMMVPTKKARCSACLLDVCSVAAPLACWYGVNACLVLTSSA